MNCQICGTPLAEGTKFCPKCGTENEGNFCTACGTKKPQPPVRCTRCGWQTEADSKPRFCPQCGTPFET